MSRMDKPFGNRPYDRQGQRFSKHGPVRPHGTDYNYEPPRRMLVALKQGMMHPKPPTYRRMDMDSFLRKLPIEHSRTSTSRSADDFKSASITLFKPAERPLSGTRITETGRNLQSRGYNPLETGGTAEFLKQNEDERNFQEEMEYRTSTGHPSARYDPREAYTYMPEAYLAKSAQEMRFNGYAARYLAPRLSGGWRYSLRQEPFVDLRGQRPIPATIYSRYRSTHPLISVSSQPWK
ncbi:testis, prostate and placenta-expressed protein-like isoform X1 [Actinia tenebrosa]|uniref:Testis, prostate and placenta-expressed protein-like isoform X1 n=1 Tax=Actinia tenebrosa TaxID=6105 RepID=A0A6P8IZD1_ACTTE|nr:testis, prostate and placenta-expressed protein-like isoform X1 [Actinia tenebrosa]